MAAKSSQHAKKRHCQREDKVASIVRRRPEGLELAQLSRKKCTATPTRGVGCIFFGTINVVGKSNNLCRSFDYVGWLGTTKNGLANSPARQDCDACSFR